MANTIVDNAGVGNRYRAAAAVVDAAPFFASTIVGNARCVNGYCAQVVDAAPFVTNAIVGNASVGNCYLAAAAVVDAASDRKSVV